MWYNAFCAEILTGDEMIHCPCGQDNPNCPCMANNKCRKKFQFPFRNETNINVWGYPQYQCIKKSCMVVLHTNRFLVENQTKQYMAPYNRYLWHNWICVINIKASLTIAALKYLYKYIYKGHDFCDVCIREELHHEEIDHYLRKRYITAMGATWSIFPFLMQHISHSAERLPVDRFGLQTVVFWRWSWGWSPGECKERRIQACHTFSFLHELDIFCTLTILVNTRTGHQRQKLPIYIV